MNKKKFVLEINCKRVSDFEMINAKKIGNFKDTENKNTSNSNGNVKQLEYELMEAKYQIEKLQKQIETNAVKDDRTTLEGQVNFLNSVIIELRNTNEQLKKEIEFLKNPFVGDEEFSPTRVKSSAPRLYCM
jgi:predicted  nucleic acid-binding Zn-ribbon protein